MLLSGFCRIRIALCLKLGRPSDYNAVYYFSTFFQVCQEVFEKNFKKVSKIAIFLVFVGFWRKKSIRTSNFDLSNSFLVHFLPTSA